jgi:hypothetical protein
MLKPLIADALINEAANATGLTDFGSESFREGLGVLLNDANAQNLSDTGHARMHASVVKALSDRLRVTDYLAKRPDVLARPIEKPVFVFGIPRTGTTLLSNLLACDPARRSALTWEIETPVPPATTATLKSDPRALAKLAQEKAMLEARPEMGKYYRNSATYPNECIFFMEHDFKALSLESRGKMPDYRDWLFSCDMTSAYEYHKRFLQLLQADAPGVWNLKMPSHVLYLDALLKVYPDARLVWTHRDPLTCLGSFCSIISLGHQAFTGTADKQFIGQNCLYQAGLHATRAMATRDKIGEHRMVDVHYADLTRDPIATVCALYAALGDAFTPEAEGAMRAWLADNPQGKFGTHDYKLDAFGLRVEDVRERFAPYLARYAIEREG